jgi:acyl-CoA synthetase (NDP forming)
MPQTVIQRVLAEQRTVLTEIESKELIAAIGIPVVEARLATTKAEAVACSRDIGFPVVLKVVSPDIIHKSDAGGVVLGLKNESQVRSAYAKVMATAQRANPGARIHGVSVQRMAQPGAEVIVGMFKDAQFGPVLMFGLGGVFVEILKDVAFGIVPVLPRDASRMINEIKGAALLRGYRGQAPADLAALEAILLRLSDFVERTPEIKEVDLNPIFAFRDGAVAVDARVILEAPDPIARGHDAPVPARPVGAFGENFPPKSIAIVGVSQKSAMGAPGFTGMTFLRVLREAGFAGHLYPINPKLEEFDGLKAYPNVTAVPEPLDLVIIAVPAAGVPKVLEECVAARAANVHICTSGFAETGEAEGKILEDRLREIAVRGGLRVIGPNCIGFHVPAARIKMFEEGELLAGPVGFLSQSGGHAINFLRRTPDYGFGLSTLISYGNALTLDAPDFVQYLADNADTRVICMYTEGVRDGRRLFDLARRTNPVKPVVIWKSGLSEAGARAAASHTASMAGDRQVWDAFFKQTGAIPVGSTEEMTEVAMTLLHATRPRGHRAVVLSGGGGNNVATGDICAQEGLDLLPLSPQTKSALQAFVSSVNQGLTNPMDAPGVLTNVPLLRRVLDVLVTDDDVDLIILHMAAAFFTEEMAGNASEFHNVLAETAQHGATAKPIVIAMDTAYPYEGTEACARQFRNAGVPAYGSIRSACRALRRVADYGATRTDSR